MHYYADYLQLLQARKLLIPSLPRAIRPWTAQFICHLFDCHEFPRILEIGRGQGHSYGLFRWLSPQSLIVSVDPAPHPVAQQIADAFPGPYRFINTTSNAAFAQGLGQEFDLILIDGDHHYRAAQQDWQNALQVAASGAIVLFDNLEHVDGCGKAFYEIAADGLVLRKLAQCGDAAVWPKEKLARGTFGVVLLR
jgi:predicted O-methyltransferase YrrM